MKRKFIALLLLFLTSAINICFSSEDDSFEVPKDNCQYCIESSLEAEYEELSNSYISKGEDLFLAGEFEDAIDNLQIGYELTSYGFKENKNINRMRSLFPMMIAYGHLERRDKVQEVSSKMISIMDSRPCSNYDSKSSAGSNDSGQCQQLPGPTNISVHECMERVRGTKHAATVFAVAIPRKEVRALTVLAIEDLADRAERCCLAGGLWKGCLIPLLNKWYAVQSSPIWFCY